VDVKIGLVGLNVDEKTVQIFQKSKEEQLFFEMSHKEVKRKLKILYKMKN
jgi:hypothetical protein